MSIRSNETFKKLDIAINEYLIYLTHIQQSLTLPLKDKIEAFHITDSIANDVNAITAKILSQNVNKFNETDIKIFIDQNFRPIIKTINDEIHIYDKKLHINERIYFSLKEAVNLLVNNKNREIILVPDKLNRLLSYKKLEIDNNEIEQNINIKKALDETVKKYEKEFDNIKLKTFQEMICGVNHKNSDYYFKINNFVIYNYLNEIKMTDSSMESELGSFFIVEKGKDIHVKVKTDTVLIEYTVNTKDVNDYATISIIGNIVRDTSKVDFYIEESFPRSSMSSYLNAFNLTPIIQKWNECYLSYYTKQNNVFEEEEIAKKDIDSFLNGDIE